MKTLNNTIKNIQKKITNNTQRVGVRLLSANGDWLPRSRLRSVPSATARVRDLRKEEFGGFKVECKSSSELATKSSRRTFYYRIDPKTVTTKQIKTLFPID
jgi:hypothetical protein